MPTTNFLRSSYPCYLANQALMTDHLLPVLDKYTDELVSQVALADAQILEQATAAATEAAQEMAKLPAYRRQEILLHCVKRFRERFEELAYVLCVEAGKPIRDSRGEVTRLIDTFRVAAEEAVRIGGEVLPMDISARASNYRGMWKRVPVGPCALITPFNFPLNLVAHKIAPAIAAGCPFVLKPSSQTPISAILCAEILAETDLPKGAFSILPCRREDAEILALDERFKLLSFTGSPDVGWNLKAKSVRKKVTLELGGNAACIVDRDADLDDAVSRLVFGAFYQSGQSCISVQRIIAHADIYDELRKRLISATSTLKIGDPKREDTFVGPLISKNEAIRIESWIASALANGAKLLFGGKRDGAFIQPALLENVPTTEPLCAKEVFGPVAVLSKFSDFEQALNQVNDSIYGLQAGIFTRDIHQIHKAWDTLEVGGIVIGDIPSWRVDHMPYGGVKNSGIGREGIRFAIEDMTEIRLLVIRLPESYT